MATNVKYLTRALSKQEGEGMGSDLVTRDLLGCCSNELGFGDPLLRTMSFEKRGSYLYDLNLTPPSLDLRLVVGSSAVATAQSSAGYQSVCTIEKVKSALERESRSKGQRQRGSSGSAPSSSSSSTTTSIKRRRSGEEEEQEGSELSSSSSLGAGAMMVAGCDICLLYVLISTDKPSCPRCGSHVRVPEFTSKKSRIDLNSIQHSLI